MSTHNIGFYEEISKIITQLSSNIIKYAPFFFCWGQEKTLSLCVVVSVGGSRKFFSVINYND